MLKFEQIKCYEQVRSTDCRLFAITYTMDILTLIWVDFLGVRFAVEEEEGDKLSP